MATNYPPKFTPVLITWIDACGDPSYDGPSDSAGDLAELNRVGFYIGRKRSNGMMCIVLAPEMHAENQHIREPIAIPEKWVRSISTLGKNERARGRR